jgi:hypothetical protein
VFGCRSEMQRRDSGAETKSPPLYRFSAPATPVRMSAVVLVGAGGGAPVFLPSSRDLINSARCSKQVITLF